MRDYIVEDDALDVSSMTPKRPEIAKSWRRSRMCGLSSDSNDLPYNEEFDKDSRLLRAARPVVDHLADQLSESPVTILLADKTGQIIDRRAGSSSILRRLDQAHVAPGFGYAEEHSGTNGIGTSLEQRELFLVSGEEHFRDALRRLACAGKPIVHPIARTVEGVLDITCKSEDVSPLMAPLIINAVADIEEQLYSMATPGERELLQHFLQLTRRGTGAIVTMSRDMYMANPAASLLLAPSDQTLLWNWASTSTSRNGACKGELRLSNDTTVQVRATHVTEIAKCPSIVFELFPAPAKQTRGIIERRKRLRGKVGNTSLPGRSLATKRLQTQLDQLADNPGPVLFSGESGVGKTSAAKHLANSWALSGETQIVDAAVRPESMLDNIRANIKRGGAVIVQHIDELPASIAPSFRSLIDDCVSEMSALIATTRRANTDNVELLATHFIRQLWVSPLRHRIEEIEDFVPYFLAENSRGGRRQLQPSALKALMHHDWPGNLRELNSELGSAELRAMGGDIAVEHLSVHLREVPSRSMYYLERIERNALIETLEDTQGNKSKAAERLGVARSTLYRKLREYGIESDRFVG